MKPGSDLLLVTVHTALGIHSDLLPHSSDVAGFGVNFKCIGLPMLIRLKRAAGRPKDLEAIAELQALLEEGDG